MVTIIVGGVIKKDNKYLLVQEAKESCRGKWSIPTGHLECNETIFEGAKREIIEECGYNVELTGIAHIRNKVMLDNEWILIIFSTKIIDGEIEFNKKEILDVKWFSYGEIIRMQNELRSDWVTSAITMIENDNVCSIDLIKVIK